MAAAASFLVLFCLSFVCFGYLAVLFLYEQAESPIPDDIPMWKPIRIIYKLGADFAEFTRAGSSNPYICLCTFDVFATVMSYALLVKSLGPRLGLRHSWLYILLAYVVALTVSMAFFFFRICLARTHNDRKQVKIRTNEADFPFTSSFLYVIGSSFCLALIAPLAYGYNPYEWLLPYLCIALGLLFPSFLYFSRFSIGTTQTVTWNAAAERSIHLLFGICIGFGVASFIRTRMNLIATVIALVPSLFDIRNFLLSNSASIFLAIEYPFLCLLLCMFVLVDHDLSIMLRILWCLGFIVFQPIATPLYFASLCTRSELWPVAGTQRKVPGKES